MATMKQALNDILTQRRQHLTYHFSIAEKENESGIFWNTRILFLLEGHHFGYISEAKEEELVSNLAFDKSKATVLCTDIKKVSGEADKVQVAFWATVNNTKVEKKWLFKFNSNRLGREWYERLRDAKERSTFVREQQQLPPIIEEKREDTPPKNKNLRISRNFNLSENVKKEKKVKEIAINATDQPFLEQPRSKPNRDSVVLLDQIYAQPKSPQKQPQPPTPEPAIIKEEPEAERQSVKKVIETKLDRNIPPPVVEEEQEPTAAFNLSNKSYLSSLKPKKSSIANLKESHASQESKSKIRSSIRKQAQTPKSIYRSKGPESQLPWTYRYIKHNHLVFDEFKAYTQSLLAEIVADLPHPRERTRFKPKLIKHGIRYYNINDLEVKLALISLEDVYVSDESVQGERVCRKEAIKTLQNEFNNFKALYEYLGDSPRLKVPLMSLCKYMGFVALFKVQSQHEQRQPSLRELEPVLVSLREKSMVEFNLEGSLNKVIIQLDEKYYNGLKTAQDKQLSFNTCIVQEIDSFLIPDVLAEPSEPFRLLRPQFVSGHSQHPCWVDYTALHQKQVPLELEQLSKNMLKVLSSVILDIDSLQVYFLNSSQMSKYLHSRGINIHYVGHIYQHLNNAFQKRFFMSQIAARSCKTLFRKTIQDLHLDSNSMSDDELHSKVCDFFNCILGNTYETAAVWKVLSTHALKYYGVTLDYDHIDREMFIIAVVFNCKLEVEWPKIRGEEVFKSNNFFTSSNLIGVKAEAKTYPPIFSSQFNTSLQVLIKPESSDAFMQLVNELNLKTQQLPSSTAPLQQRLLKYLSLFISPQKALSDFAHLGLFGRLQKYAPARYLFDLCLMQLKWHLKRKQKQDYIRCCDMYIRQATTRFGEFHPVLSELYDLFSAYHLNCSQYEDAIIFSKSSLVNILKVCGGNHERTSECYYHLALCYIRANRRDEAIVHIRKSKLIFQSNNKTNSVAYATMSLKLALLLLNQDEIEECLNTTVAALQLFESKTTTEDPGKFEDEITECFELMSRCYEVLQVRSQMEHLSDQCFVRLPKITQPFNLQKLLKMYLYPMLSGLSSDLASVYLDILTLFKVESSQKNYLFAYRQLNSRIEENSLGSSLGVYLSKLSIIHHNIRDHNLTEGWINFEELYPRETVKDFMSLTIELLTFLGQGYMSGALREAL